MIKITQKAVFDSKSNRMKKIGDVENAINEFKKKKNKNLDFLLKKRFSWMKKFIDEKNTGLEVGAGGGFSKNFIKNKNFKISDLAMYDHLDFKNVDAQKTQFESNYYDFVIAVNMIHHVPYPIKFLNEMHRILKKGGRLIIQEAYCSVIFQVITIIMRHEGFDFTKEVWNENQPMSDENDRWSGNIAIPHLIFDDVDAIVIVTEWNDYIDLDWPKLIKKMKRPSWIFDTRNILEKELFYETGVNFWSLGTGINNIKSIN